MGFFFFTIEPVCVNSTLSFAFRLEIKQDREGPTFVAGLVEAKVNNIKEAWDFLQAGSNARTVASNNVNEHSSRSHWLVPNFINLFFFVD